ncbi:hypothetical protein CsSME_00038795 [Camellia sinensis var. sinensis]
MMTCQGQGGETYQIPIAPPPADHELVGFSDLPPASSEYTRQSLELSASLMGMLQRSLDLLAMYSIPPPFLMPTVGGAPTGPFAPTEGDGRVYPRTKAGRTHVGSSSRAPVPDDDDESEAEAESGAESSEEETEDGSGSDSNDDADDDALRPSSRKRTRTDP